MGSKFQNIGITFPIYCIAVVKGSVVAAFSSRESDSAATVRMFFLMVGVP